MALLRTRSAEESLPQRITGGEPFGPLALLTALSFTDTLDVAAFSLLIPEIRSYFGVSLGSIETVIAFATLLPLVAAVPIGYLADRVPRSVLIGIGFVLSGIFSSGTGLATGLVMLGVMRLGAGLGKCFEGSTQSLVSDMYPIGRRAGVLTLLAMGPTAGLLIGPLLAGWLGGRAWQYPFLIAGLPTLAMSWFVFKLRNPPRGGQERRAMGADEATIAAEEAPPGWTEGWRIARSVRSLRLLWASLPFLVGSLVVVATLFPVLLHDDFGVSTAGRGALTALQQGVAVLALFAIGPYLTRQLARSPARLITLAGLLATLTAGFLALAALSPWLPLTAVAMVGMSLCAVPLAPAIGALISLTVPSRVRAFALSFGSLFVAVGVFFGSIIAGGLSDSFGIRGAIVFMAVVFVVGALIVASAGSVVGADVRAATAAAMAGEIVRQARAEGRTKLLVCQDLDAGYGQVQILFNVDLQVEEGEIIALLGTNGAGKSTLLAAIDGTNPAWNGAVLFDGDDITRLPASEHLARGIVSVPGGKAIVPGLTVADNLRLALWASPDSRTDRLEEAYQHFPRLRERRSEPAGNLSGGEQQMLALAQALVVRPRLLIIDELSLGLAPIVVEQLLGIVRTIHESGATVILVEQSVNVALTIATRAIFMEKGEVRFTGPTAELLERPDVLRSVFLAGAATASGSFARGRRRPVDNPDEVVLQVSDVRRAYGGVQALDGATLELKAGETLGIIGPNGAGKTTLLDVISGFVTPDSGTVHLLGEDVTELSAAARAVKGLGRSFQDARLFPSLTVEEIVLFALDMHFATRNPVASALNTPGNRKREASMRKRADRLIELLGLGVVRDRFAAELSTGTRRLVDLACVLAADPEVLLLDEPSSGIAQKETEELPAVLDRIKYETGCALVIIEHDMALISAVSDELLAMETGRDVVRGTPTEVLADPRVVAAYLGSSQAAIVRSGHT